MVARVTGVIDQLKEHESQEEIKANEIFVGRDRDIQLSLGLLGVQSGLTDELCREDLDFIRKQSLRVKGVYLSGIGGQEKTTLARKVCGSLSEANEPWESVMVSLRNRNSFEEVLQAFLSKLGVLLTIHVTSRENIQNNILAFIKTTEQTLRNLHDHPEYPPLVTALYHKVKGQAFWRQLKYDEAMQHLRLSEHFYEIRDEREELMLRPAESYRVLKTKLLKFKGLLLLDLKKLDEGETALQKAYELLEEQVYVKNEKNESAIRVRELKKLSIRIPEFFTHFGAIQMARLEKVPDTKNKLLNKALEYLNEGMELDKQLHIDSLGDFAAKMKLCADVYIEQGLYDEAEQYASSAERQRRPCLTPPHINVTESVYQKGKVFILKGLGFLEKGNKKHGKHYLHCAEDWFGELEFDHLINGSIPTVTTHCMLPLS